MQEHKNLVVLALVTLLSISEARAQLKRQGGGSYVEHNLDFQSPMHYSFEYSVHNPETGDLKRHKETRRGDSVIGFYTISQQDGTARQVHYDVGGPQESVMPISRSQHTQYSNQYSPPGINHY